jgi:hypothetical protein
MKDAAAARLDGFEPRLTFDLGGLPAPLRRPLAAALDEQLQALGAQFLTLDLGVNETQDLVRTRLVATFSDA